MSKEFLICAPNGNFVNIAGFGHFKHGEKVTNEKMAKLFPHVCIEIFKTAEEPVPSEELIEEPVVTEEASDAPILLEEPAPAEEVIDESPAIEEPAEVLVEEPVTSEELIEEPVVTEEASETPVVEEVEPVVEKAEKRGKKNK